MTSATCPCCGQATAPEIVLPPIKQRIFDAVRRRPGLDAEALRTMVWAEDPAGGPEDRKVLHVHIHQLNRRLAPHRIAVRGSRSHGYRIQPMDAGAVSPDP
jgi:DNA-binding response OmpR family regulator